MNPVKRISLLMAGSSAACILSALVVGLVVPGSGGLRALSGRVCPSGAAPPVTEKSRADYAPSVPQARWGRGLRRRARRNK